MRDLKTINSEIEQKNASIEEIQTRITEGQRALMSRKTEFAKALLEKDSKNLDKHRNAIHHANIEAEGLQGVKELLEAELLELQTEADAATLYGTDAERHNGAMSDVDTAIGILNKKLPILKNLSEELAGAIRTCFDGTAAACSSLAGLPNDLDSALSLEALLNGELEPSDDAEDREALLDAIGQDLQESIVGLQIPEMDLATLGHLLDQAEKWRAVIESFQTGADLIRNKKRLVPALSKRPRTERVTMPARPPRASHAAQMDFRPVPRFDRNRPAGEQFIGTRETF